MTALQQHHRDVFINEKQWTEIFCAPLCSLYTLNAVTKHWVSPIHGYKRKCIVKMLQHSIHKKDVRVRIQYETYSSLQKPDICLWYRLASSKCKTKGERTLCFKVVTLEFEQEILALRFQTSELTMEILTNYHLIFPAVKPKYIQIQDLQLDPIALEHCSLVYGYSKQIHDCVPPEINDIIVSYYAQPLLLNIKDETRSHIKRTLYNPVRDNWISVIGKMQKQLGIKDDERMRTLFYGHLQSTEKEEINANNWESIRLNKAFVFEVYDYKWLCRLDAATGKVFYQRILYGFTQWERPSEPVTSHWIAYVSEQSGGLYFVNIVNGKHTLNKPNEFSDPKETWIARKLPTDEYYYVHVETQQRYSDVPECFASKIYNV